MADEFCLKMPYFHVTFRDLLHAVNLRHGTDGFTSAPKEGVLRVSSPWKIQRLRSGFNARTWVPKASTVPLDHRSRLFMVYWVMYSQHWLGHTAWSSKMRDFRCPSSCKWEHLSLWMLRIVDRYLPNFLDNIWFPSSMVKYRLNIGPICCAETSVSIKLQCVTSH